jgi:glycerate kinase
VESFFGVLADGETAVVEAAAACGLTQVPPARRDPRVTTSRGLGELMKAALDSGAKRLIVGIGGSATNDGGCGLLRAFGARFLDESGHDLPEGGASLARLAAIDLSDWSGPKDASELLVASDVNNPLFGDAGASAVFGPQKGATPDMVRELDAALSNYATVCASALGRDCSRLPGAGAAGGIGFALLAFCSATLRPGVELILEAARFSDRAALADLIVTGEGRLDSQTARGKAVLGVARAGKGAGKPVVALAGSLSGDLRPLKGEGLCAAASISPGPMTVDEMMENASPLLTDAAERMMGWLLAGELLSEPF